MVDTALCGQCGARNAVEADWCGQCFASMGEVPAAGSKLSTSDEVSATPTEPGTSEIAVDSSLKSVEGDAPLVPGTGNWVCTACDRSNPLEAQECSACGTSIFAAFGAADEEKLEVDPQRALLRSVIFPGLGHALAGQGLLGAAIGGVTLMALGFGITLAATQVGSYGWPLILLAGGIWVAAALDSFRIASGAEDALLLRPRVVTALVGLVVVVVIMAALTEGRS